jgi:hypothetical protein
VAVVITSLSAMFPTGVPGQYSSYGAAPPGGTVTGGGSVVVGVTVTVSSVRMAKSLGVVPEAQQAVVDEHDTADTPKTSLGTPWVLHRLPPSVVATMVPPGNIGPGIGPPTPIPPTPMKFDPPPAQQAVVEGHEMLVRNPVPKGRLCAAQVAPASVVAKTPPPGDEAPNVQQAVVVGHEIDVNGPLLAGTCCRCQVAPPSVVATTSPP